MPIANCHVVSMLDDLDPNQIVAEWSKRSGIKPDEMTLNLVASRQGGKRYAAMAWLSRRSGRKTLSLHSAKDWRLYWRMRSMSSIHPFRS